MRGKFVKAFIKEFDGEVYPGKGKNYPEVVVANDDVMGFIYKKAYK